MSNYKMEAAAACLALIKRDQIIGLGAGATIAYLVDLISERPDLAGSVIFVSSSFKTRLYIQQKGLLLRSSSQLNKIDIYFDGCDCFDPELNALKSGGGIHTNEKILALMADAFVLIGDESKFVLKIDTVYPLVVEILPEAFPFIGSYIRSRYPDATFSLRMSTQKDGAVISENGNLIADIQFEKMPELDKLNTAIKMIPGVVEHSLFYRMATKAIIAGEKGVREIFPEY